MRSRPIGRIGFASESSRLPSEPGELNRELAYLGLPFTGFGFPGRRPARFWICMNLVALLTLSVKKSALLRFSSQRYMWERLGYFASETTIIIVPSAEPIRGKFSAGWAVTSFSVLATFPLLLSGVMMLSKVQTYEWTPERFVRSCSSRLLFTCERISGSSSPPEKLNPFLTSIIVLHFKNAALYLSELLIANVVLQPSKRPQEMSQHDFTFLMRQLISH